MSDSSYPAVGKKAPAIRSLAISPEHPEGAKLQLSDLKGSKVVLYFYPKDDTPGCTTQACGLRDGWSEISAKAKVFGISPDSAASHAKFIKKHQLPFPLILDEDHQIAEAYGVWVEKSMYGKKYFGVERTTFVIDEDGKLQAVLPKVKPAEHLQQVMALL